MTEEAPPPLRDSTGRFRPGAGSPNPGGRPRAIADLVEAARAHTRAAIDALAEIATSPKSPPGARVAACGELLSRGWGRPSQSIEVSRPLGRDLSQMSDSELIAIAIAALPADSPILASLDAPDHDRDRPAIGRTEDR